MAAGRSGADDGAQIFRAGRDQPRRQDAFLDQAVRPVDIGNRFLEQLGPLDQAGTDRGPFLLLYQERHMRQRPFALIGAGLIVETVIDAGVAQILVGAGEALGELFRPQIFQRLDELLPDRTGIA
jgi:hypothetical protein